MRRAANPTRKISITIPSRTFNALDSHLSYDQSRSRFISSAIEDKLNASTELTIDELSTVQLKLALHHRICGCHETASCPTNVLLRNLSTS